MLMHLQSSLIKFCAPTEENWKINFSSALFKSKYSKESFSMKIGCYVFPQDTNSIQYKHADINILQCQQVCVASGTDCTPKHRHHQVSFEAEFLQQMIKSSWEGWEDFQGKFNFYQTNWEKNCIMNILEVYAENSCGFYANIKTNLNLFLLQAKLVLIPGAREYFKLFLEY